MADVGGMDICKEGNDRNVQRQGQRDEGRDGCWGGVAGWTAGWTREDDGMNAARARWRVSALERH